MQQIEKEFTNRLDAQIHIVRDCQYKNLFEKNLISFESPNPVLKVRKHSNFSNKFPVVIKVESSKNDILRPKTTSHCFQKLSTNFKSNANPFSEILAQIDLKRSIPMHQFIKQPWFFDKDLEQIPTKFKEEVHFHVKQQHEQEMKSEPENKSHRS